MFENGKENGEWKEYYENGQLSGFGKYENANVEWQG
jgi:antitoxin component YwqK of YwqJK toxin-antitoxin module